MRRRSLSARRLGLLVLCGLGCGLGLTKSGWSQGLQVTAHVDVTRQQGSRHSAGASSEDVVVWLTPLQKDPSPSSGKIQQYTLIQKDKQFSPHLLVVPTGSSVEFPNLDPFFHNVFSLFNGKRFDLGLYEAHTQRSVRFDRDGVSYIFCNIHPEMGAVVISLSTPYYGVSTRDGSVTLRDVPPGSYQLNVWAENVSIERLGALSRTVEIGSQSVDLGRISLQTSGDIMSHHQNKFGESYRPAAQDPY